MKVAVLYGSVRSARKGIRAARFAVQELSDRGHDVTLLDAAEMDLPMLDRMYKEYDGDAPASMQWGHEVLRDADAFVVVGGEYNHSVPPGLKNLLDTYQAEYTFKPAAIMTYSAGPFGGVRAAPHYRAILGELGMVTISIMFAVSRVGKAMTEAGADATPEGDWRRRAQRFWRELEWYGEALGAKRAREGTPDQPAGDRPAKKADASEAQS